MSLEEEFQETQTLAKRVEELSRLMEMAAESIANQAELILRLTKNAKAMQERVLALEQQMDDQSDN